MTHVTKGALPRPPPTAGSVCGVNELLLWLACHRMEEDARGNIGHLTNTGSLRPSRALRRPRRSLVLHCGHGTHHG